MPSWTPKEKQWREWLRGKLQAAGVWEDFNRLRMDYSHNDKVATGQCNKIVDRRAWHQVANLFTEHFNQDEFDRLRENHLAKDKPERTRRQMKKARDSMAPSGKKIVGNLTEKELDRIIEPPDDEVVIIDNSNDGDILRDTKWVYFNMARLIKIARGGTKTLDKKVLREAPSNGAVGLAQYALADQKAFMEKFVTKILPKDEAPDKVVTEEDLKAELDPGLDELARYMKKMQ